MSFPSIYLRKLKGPAAGQAAEQLTPFLTDLIKAVNSLPNAVLVFTLALGRGGQAVDAYGEENQRIERIFAELESVTGRQVTALTPTSEDETVQVLCRRLFASIDRSRVGKVVRAYQDLWSRHAEALPPVGQNDDRAEALRKGYPLHPELIDTLMQKTSTLENFQRVRGMLRLLAQTVGQLWREQPGDATAIHLHHVDPATSGFAWRSPPSWGSRPSSRRSGPMWPAPAPRTVKPWPNTWMRTNLRVLHPTAP